MIAFGFDNAFTMVTCFMPELSFATVKMGAHCEFNHPLVHTSVRGIEVIPPCLLGKNSLLFFCGT